MLLGRNPATNGGQGCAAGRDTASRRNPRARAHASSPPRSRLGAANPAERWRASLEGRLPQRRSRFHQRILIVTTMLTRHGPRLVAAVTRRPWISPALSQGSSAGSVPLRPRSLASGTRRDQWLIVGRTHDPCRPAAGPLLVVKPPKPRKGSALAAPPPLSAAPSPRAGQSHRQTGGTGTPTGGRLGLEQASAALRDLDPDLGPHAAPGARLHRRREKAILRQLGDAGRGLVFGHTERRRARPWTSPHHRAHGRL